MCDFLKSKLLHSKITYVVSQNWNTCDALFVLINTYIFCCMYIYNTIIYSSLFHPIDHYEYCANSYNIANRYDSSTSSLLSNIQFKRAVLLYKLFIKFISLYRYGYMYNSSITFSLINIYKLI